MSVKRINIKKYNSVKTLLKQNRGDILFDLWWQLKVFEFKIAMISWAVILIVSGIVYAIYKMR